MVHVTLADDSSSVVLPSGTITGPVAFFADEVTHNSNEFSSGILVVVGGVAHQTSQISPVHVFLWPYALVTVIILGFMAASLRR